MSIIDILHLFLLRVNRDLFLLDSLKNEDKKITSLKPREQIFQRESARRFALQYAKRLQISFLQELG